MEIRWSSDALRDLRGIYIQLLFRSNKAAQKISAQIFNDAEILKNHPNAGKREPYLEECTFLYRSLVSKATDYKIVYYIDDKLIHIIAIWDCRRDPGDMAKKLIQENK